MKQTAGLLEEKTAIPMVSDQMPLIQDVQTDAWWQDVTTPMLEAMPSFLAGTLRSSMS